MRDETFAAWFQRRVGRPPASAEEAAAYGLTQIMRLNPRLLAKRNFIVHHAEELGGLHLRYAKVRYPHYWDEWKLPRSNEQVSNTLGISQEDGWKLWNDVQDLAMPACKSSAMYRSQPQGEYNELDLDE